MLTRVDVRVYWDFIAPGIWEIKNHSDPEWKPEDIYAALLNNVAELYIDIDEDPCESFIILQEKPNIFMPTKSFLIWIAYDKRGGAASKYMAGALQISTTIADTPSQKALASIAAQRFNLYQQYYVPLENQYIGEVYSMMDPSAFDSVSGFVNAATQPQFQAAARNMQSMAFQRGIDPQSGQYQARAEDLARVQARGQSEGLVQGLSSQVDRYYQGMQNIVAMGQGQAGQAITGLGEIGRQAQSVAGARARTALAGDLARGQMLGTAVGTGIGLYGMNSGGGGGSE